MFKFCEKDEVCEETDDEAHCRCKVNYHRNEETNKCEYDLCKSIENEEDKCGEHEKCVTVLGENKPRCICPIEHKYENNKCMAEKKENNPFIKQLHNCAHTYTINKKTNQVQCKCFPGYKLADDKVSCLGDLSDKCLGKCTIRQICVLNEQTDLHECMCHLGFSGDKCQKSYCYIGSNREEIRHICGSDSCTERKRGERKLGFTCDCDKHLADEDSQGFCALKKVCSDSKIKECEEQGKICIPKLDVFDKFLDGVCVCKYKTNCDMNFTDNIHDFIMIQVTEAEILILILVNVRAFVILIIIYLEKKSIKRLAR